MTTELELLTEYLSLIRTEKKISKELNVIRDKIKDQESMILSRFGLPEMPKYLFDLGNLIYKDNPENEFKYTLKKLQQYASAYLKSVPKTDLETLKNAKINKLLAYEILPELGLNNSFYNYFIYNEIFMKGIDSAENVLSILKNEELNDNLPIFHYYTYEVIKLRKEIAVDRISYFTEYMKYNPDITERI